MSCRGHFTAMEQNLDTSCMVDMHSTDGTAYPVDSFCLETGSHYAALAPGIHRDPLVSVSQVLGSQVCVLTSPRLGFFRHQCRW